MKYPPLAGTVPDAGDRAVNRTLRCLPLGASSLVGAEGNKLNKEPNKTSESDEGYEENSECEGVSKGDTV